MSTLKRINDSAGRRLFIAIVIGLAVAGIGYGTHLGNLSVLIGWDAAVVTFVTWVLFIIWPMGHEQTARFALREDPSRVGTDVILILASLASLGAVGYALFIAHTTTDSTHRTIFTIVSILSVVLSWILIHTIYALRYARMYYSPDIEGTVDFKHDHKPPYADFVYLAFTTGMTFQVADTDLIGTAFRKAVLGHALLSYVFGTVIVATTVSLIGGLGI